ncbi:MAG: hypothetical protein R3E95_04680 [Thiolinea sp.]
MADQASVTVIDSLPRFRPDLIRSRMPIGLISNDYKGDATVVVNGSTILQAQATNNNKQVARIGVIGCDCVEDKEQEPALTRHLSASPRRAGGCSALVVLFQESIMKLFPRFFPFIPVCYALALLSTLPVQASFFDNPELTDISAKHAKLRAKMRAVRADAEQQGKSNLSGYTDGNDDP